MERIPELLLSLGKEDSAKVEMKTERSSTYTKYKLEALKCEQALRDRKKQNHKILLERISQIEKELQRKKHNKELKEASISQTTNKDRQPKAVITDEDTAELETICSHTEDSQSVNLKAKQRNESAVEKVLVESFSKLEDLQNQQKNLENWYQQMSEQLQLEQCRLSEKYDDMRVKILQRKQYFLQTSQEYIKNLSHESSNYNGNQNFLLQRPDAFIENLEESVSSMGSSQKAFSRYSVQAESPELEPVRDPGYGVNSVVHHDSQKCTPHSSGRNDDNTAKYDDNATLLTPSGTTSSSRSYNNNQNSLSPALVTSSHKKDVYTKYEGYRDSQEIASGQGAIPKRPIPNEAPSSSTSCDYYSARSSSRFERNLHDSRSQTSEMQYDHPSFQESNELVEKTLLISPVQTTNIGSKSRTANFSKESSVKTDLLHRYAMITSPNKDNNLIRGSASTNQSNFYGNISHSTPVRSTSFKKTMPDANVTQQSEFSSVSDPSLKSSFDRLGAVAVGYLTRKLMQTEKVQTLIKTIKDTKAVLAGLERDTSFTSSKHSAVKVEQQLKENVHQELVNAQSKLYNILLKSTPSERIEVISKSRLAAANRQNLQYYKNRAKSSVSISHPNPGKRLSTATQKSIRRKQDNPLNQKSLSRPHTSPAGKSVIAEGKKLRKVWESRSLKPTQSEGSPLYSERSKNIATDSKPQESSVKQTEECSVVTSKDVPIKRKIARKRQLAVTLSRKTIESNS